MNEADALDIVQAAIWTVLAASGPAVVSAMVVGLVVALIQAGLARWGKAPAACCDSASRG